MPASASRKRPTGLQLWIRAARAPSLIAAILPVLLGGGLALIDRGFDSWPFLITMIAVMFLQAATNLINDYYDYLRGADSPDLPPSVLQMGWLTPRQVHQGGLLCFLIAALLGVYLSYVGGLLIAVLGLISIALCYLFTGTRYALAYRALGELTVFLLYGPLLVFVTYYVMVKIPYSHVLLNGVPVGLLTAASLFVSNLRDIRHDRQIGKHTLPTVLGPQRSKGLYALMLAVAYLLLVAMWLFDLTPVTSLFALLTLPLAVHNVRVMRRTSDPVELNLVFGLTGLLQLLFGILHVFGIFVYYFANI